MKNVDNKISYIQTDIFYLLFYSHASFHHLEKKISPPVDDILCHHRECLGDARLLDADVQDGKSDVLEEGGCIRTGLLRLLASAACHEDSEGEDEEMCSGTHFGRFCCGLVAPSSQSQTDGDHHV